MLVNIANAQANMGAEVHVIVINELYETGLLNRFGENVNVHFIHRKLQSKGLGYAFRMNKLLLKLAPDAIHLHSSKLFILLWRKRLSRVASVTLHDLPIGSVRRSGILPKILPIVNYLNTGNVTAIDRIPKVFSISQAVKDELLKQNGVDSIVVNNGILTDSFKRRDRNLLEGKLRIVQVSRLEHDKKGQDLLIAAVEKLRNSVVVDFIGDGNSRDFLSQLVKEKGLQDEIRFLGTKSQAYIAEHLCDYDLFVQPSRWEGFGLTVAEAMSSNLPVLVSAGQGPAEVTCGDKYGWTFINGNVDDLSEHIRYIAEHYDEALKKSKDALHYVQDTYDVSVTARKYLEMYGK